MLSIDDHFKGRHFDREIIILCVRWYLRFKLSFRDLMEMMAERGISLAHTTIMRGINATSRSSKSAGTASHARLGGPGASMKPT
jgi:transposase-like protein